MLAFTFGNDAMLLASASTHLGSDIFISEEDGNLPMGIAIRTPSSTPAVKRTFIRGATPTCYRSPTATVNETKTGIDVRSRISGTDFSIGELGGQTATQLGLRTTDADTA